MKILVTGSAGHLGEALVRTLRARGDDVIGIDLLESPFTTRRGSIVDRGFVREYMNGVEAVLHAATLHKPHVATNSRQDFVDTNISGTLNLLEEAASAGVRAFIYTSTTSVFGHALTPAAAEPAAWITEEVTPVPRNIYGVTKAAAEDLCELFHGKQGLNCLVLRTSRFFPEEDDNRETRQSYSDANSKVNEFLYRRVDIEDVVSAHLLALDRAQGLGFRKYIVSATSPFGREHLAELVTNAPRVVQSLFPQYDEVYRKLGWRMFPSIGRVYVNERARQELGWKPRYDFRSILERLAAGEDFRSALARQIGSKGYHAQAFADGPYPVD